MSTTVDKKLFMVVFEGVETEESALSVRTGGEIVSVLILLDHFRTWGSNESM